MFALIKGAGDLASGIAVRLHNSGFRLVMTDLPEPTSIRRSVCFSESIRYGTQTIEGVTARFAASPDEVPAILDANEIAVLADEKAACIEVLHPDAVVDAILAKRNLNTRMEQAPIVIGVGPGFTAGVDCHAVVETQRGHDLGRVILSGNAAPNTGIPGVISGFSVERVLRAPCAGTFHELHHIGDLVEKGETVATVEELPVVSQISGVLRGLLPEGTPVQTGMKSGDVDPRCEVMHCYTVSDKARAVAGGVLEALLRFSAASC